MTHLFLDTNIVVDLLEHREPFYHDAVRLFTMAYNKQVQLIVSPMTYATVSFLLRKHGSEGVRNLLSNFRQLYVLPPRMNVLLMILWPHSLRILRMLCSIIQPFALRLMSLSLETAKTSLRRKSL